MKSSQILASVLFGSIAAAAPFKRDLVTKTEVKYETVIVYTTVWDDVASATTTAGGYFYEQPTSSSVEAKPTTTEIPTSTPAAAAAPVKETSSSTTAAPVQTSAAPAPVVSPAPAPEPETAAPAPAPTTSSTTTEAAYTPEPVTSATPAPTTTTAAAAPAAETQASTASGSSSGSATGDKYSGDITIYDNNGGYGACGTALYDTDMIVALAKDAWGASTYDAMTGQATNPWCGQKIAIQYNGNQIEATIMDLCPGCSGHDIDLSLAAWKKLTGTDEKTRFKATWNKIS